MEESELHESLLPDQVRPIRFVTPACAPVLPCSIARGSPFSATPHPPLTRRLQAEEMKALIAKGDADAAAAKAKAAAEEGVKMEEANGGGGGGGGGGAEEGVSHPMDDTYEGRVGWGRGFF